MIFAQKHPTRPSYTTSHDGLTGRSSRRPTRTSASGLERFRDCSPRSPARKFLARTATASGHCLRPDNPRTIDADPPRGPCISRVVIRSAEGGPREAVLGLVRLEIQIDPGSHSVLSKEKRACHLTSSAYPLIIPFMRPAKPRLLTVRQSATVRCRMCQKRPWSAIEIGSVVGLMRLCTPCAVARLLARRAA